MTSVVDLTAFFPTWWYDSNCFSQGDEVFFGSDDSPSSLRNARIYCRNCPVIRDCLEHALTQPEEYGIWAGTSARSREVMRSDISTGMVSLDHVIDTVVRDEFRWRRNERR